LLVVAVECDAETVVMVHFVGRQGFAVHLFKAEAVELKIGGQDFTAAVAADIENPEARGAPERAFANISHGIRLGLPAAFFQHRLDGGNKRNRQKQAAEKLMPLSFTGGKRLGGKGGEEIDFRAHGGSR
jgi:hypothetical protein